MSPAARTKPVLGDTPAPRAATMQAAGGRWGTKPAAPAVEKPKVLSRADRASLAKGELDTPSGTYRLNQHPLPAPGAVCPKCHALKVRPRPNFDTTDVWCSGCGWWGDCSDLEGGRTPLRSSP